MFLLDLAAVRAMLRDAAKPTRAAWARAHEIAPSYVNDVLAERCEPGEKLLDALGLERVISYRTKDRNG